MKLLVIKRMAINIDRIDGITPNIVNENETFIYVGGSDEPFTVKKPFESVVDMISNVCKEEVVG